MKWEKRRIAFADEKLGLNYERISSSKHPEDERLHAFLTEIRTELGKKWESGQKVTDGKRISLYERMFQIKEVWQVEIPPHGTVLFSVTPEAILIVDIL